MAPEGKKQNNSESTNCAFPENTGDSNHKVHFEGVDSPTSAAKVTFQEVEGTLRSAEGVAHDMKVDADKAEEWISNAKLAIDIANNSLSEAGKLAAHVQMTAEQTASKMTKLSVEHDVHDNAEEAEHSGQRGMESATADLVDVELDQNKERYANEYEDILSLQKRSKELQAMVGQSASHLKDTRSELTGTALSSAVDMKDQADDLTVNLEETIRQIKQKKDHHRTGTPVGAEDILKGDATAVDPLSLDKIDGVLELSRSQEKLSELDKQEKGDIPPLKEDTPVDAEDVLKNGGALNADPVSLDKIDGLPVRTHNSEELAAKDHRNPTLPTY